ncbi:MAG: hypothetical protein KGI97_02615 [Alphaproteobacteria bacterium]|nr:hypothetical protein [Alphaproteobacteria bacterium]
MTLQIKTFSNQSGGGNAFYKAATHPLTAAKARELAELLKGAGKVAIYDPLGQLESFAEFFPLGDVEVAGLFVQDVEQIGHVWHNHAARPVTELKDCDCKAVLVAAFDAARLTDHIRAYIPAQSRVHSFDALRLPDAMLSDRRNYLATLNFATNFAFFRDGDGQHTRVVTANYWSSYGAQSPRIWCCLIDDKGEKRAEWMETLPPAGATVTFDSDDIRKRFNLPAFTGQLFLHVVGAAGHDIVKYALDTYGDEPHVLSCTHDANAWPSNQYAGLPAPTEDETVVLWLQNSHPREIPAGEIGLNLMGNEKIAWLDKPIAPYGTYKLDVAALLPDAHWPQQIEIQANKNFVRPRYEITTKSNGHTRISHPNVEREDLKPDPKLATLGDLFGKLYILPAPVLPTERFASLALPTPMATGQKHLPVKALIYDARGKLMAEHKFGNLKRSDSIALDLNEILSGKKLDGGYGHVEIVYDFEAGQEADGWLHALFRYHDRKSGHAAETSFGAHIFNTVLTYKNEPQSYAGRAPGLSTRLFLRMGAQPYDTMCHLIYPASTPWRGSSDTALVLTGGMDGKEIAKKTVRIPCGGSLLWKTSEMFSKEQIAAAGTHPYVLIRDVTCRLFGYHGLISADKAFSLDHMFGF